MKIVKFTSISNKLLQDWKNLWNKSANATMQNSPGWFIASLYAFDEKQCAIIAIYDDFEQELIAIAPFVEEKLYGLTVLTVPGREFADKPSILFDPDNLESAKLLFNEISKLGNIYLTEFTLDQTQKIQEVASRLTAFKSNLNPYIDFSQGKYGDLGNHRINLILNRAKKAQYQIKIFSSVDNLLHALEIAFQIDMGSTKHQLGRGLFHRQDAKKFYKKLVISAPENVIVCVMYFDQKPVSYIIDFLHHGRSQGSQKAYLPGFEYYKPGKLTYIKLLDYYYNTETTEADLGRGYDHFKRDFTHKYRQLYNIIISRDIYIRHYIALIFKLRNLVYVVIEKYSPMYIFYKKLMLYFAQ